MNSDVHIILIIDIQIMLISISVMSVAIYPVGIHIIRVCAMLLNITVTAKKGRALFWTSVMSDAPYERDDRTDHEALTVEGGVK